MLATRQVQKVQVCSRALRDRRVLGIVSGQTVSKGEAGRAKRWGHKSGANKKVLPARRTSLVITVTATGKTEADVGRTSSVMWARDGALYSVSSPRLVVCLIFTF